MSPEQSIWLLSMVGALLFMGVGFFGARATAREGPQLEPRPVREDTREETRAELSQLRNKLEAHRNEVLVLRQEKMALANALDEAERRARDEAERRAREAPPPPEPEPTPDLDMELAAARSKLADLDRLREENTRLRSMAAESTNLRVQVQRLEAEQTDLKARAFAHPVEEPQELPMVPSMPGAFEKIVTEVARSSHARSVAIADELGFTIAGTGAEHEGLAALCGLLGEIERRAQMLLPVGAVRRITLEMDHGAGVSVCPIARSDTRIALATLTVGPRPDTVSLTGAIEQASELLFR